MASLWEDFYGDDLDTFVHLELEGVEFGGHHVLHSVGDGDSCFEGAGHIGIAFSVFFVEVVILLEHGEVDCGAGDSLDSDVVLAGLGA